MASKTQNQTVPTLFPIHAVGRFLIRSVGDGKSSGRRLDVLGHQWHCLPRDDCTRCPRQWLSRRTDLSPNGASQKAWLSLGRGDRAVSSPSLQHLNKKGTDLLFLKNKPVPFSLFQSVCRWPLLVNCSPSATGSNRPEADARHYLADQRLRSLQHGGAVVDISMKQCDYDNWIGLPLD